MFLLFTLNLSLTLGLLTYHLWLVSSLSDLLLLGNSSVARIIFLQFFPLPLLFFLRLIHLLPLLFRLSLRFLPGPETSSNRLFLLFQLYNTSWFILCWPTALFITIWTFLMAGGTKIMLRGFKWGFRFFFLLAFYLFVFVLVKLDRLWLCLNRSGCVFWWSFHLWCAYLPHSY